MNDKVQEQLHSLKDYAKDKGIEVKTSIEAVASQTYTLDWNVEETKCTITMPRFCDDKELQVLTLAAYIVYIEYCVRTSYFSTFPDFPIYKLIATNKLKKEYILFIKEKNIYTQTPEQQDKIEYDIFKTQYPYNQNIVSSIDKLLTMFFKLILFELKVLLISFVFIVFAVFSYGIITKQVLTIEKLQIYITFISPSIWAVFLVINIYAILKKRLF